MIWKDSKWVSVCLISWVKSFGVVRDHLESYKSWGDKICYLIKMQHCSKMHCPFLVSQYYRCRRQCHSSTSRDGNVMISLQCLRAVPLHFSPPKATWPTTVFLDVRSLSSRIQSNWMFFKLSSSYGKSKSNVSLKVGFKVFLFTWVFLLAILFSLWNSNNFT